MMVTNKFLKIFISTEAILIFALIGCVNPEPLQTDNSPEPTGDIIDIARGTVGRIGNISIGLVNTGTSEYLDSSGVKQKGLVAWLELRDKTDESENSIMVYPGQSFEFHGYTFYVKEIKAPRLFPWSPPGATGGGSISLISGLK
jgi:hypothetical protein